MSPKIPHIKIKNKFQKQEITYKDIIKPNILKDICKAVSKNSKYTIDFDDTEPYNKGRLAKIRWKKKITYVSFSEQHIQARNSTLQSFPTAYTQWFDETNPKNPLYFYFLEPTICDCHPSPNIETPYLMFNYRLMATLGVKFLNSKKNLKQKITPFNSIDDIIKNKDSLRVRNRSNNSSFITKNTEGITEVYGKSYGASKYESSFLALAASTFVDKVIFYEIIEGNLKKLPKNIRNVLESQNKIEFISDNKARNKNMVYPEALRRPYQYHAKLLEKLGPKKCAFCGYDENSSNIAGAHIWPKSEIQASKLSRKKKIEASNDGENGLWLCTNAKSTTPNHHRMFDNHEIIISKSGELKITKSLISNKKHIRKIRMDNIGSNAADLRNILTPEFLKYLKKRNKVLPELEKYYVSIAEIR
jgi:hypothetical protein